MALETARRRWRGRKGVRQQVKWELCGKISWGKCGSFRNKTPKSPPLSPIPPPSRPVALLPHPHLKCPPRSDAPFCRCCISPLLVVCVPVPPHRRRWFFLKKTTLAKQKTVGLGPTRRSGYLLKGPLITTLPFMVIESFRPRGISASAHSNDAASAVSESGLRPIHAPRGTLFSLTRAAFGGADSASVCPGWWRASSRRRWGWRPLED